ncbi:hypothetical protein COU62_01840 [Candidatus Pacearchaeota archaeon CG10_big_fil_rev_8_21_14_0_10_35_219]|nr:MAG: hypothetical protein COU62_01840 [Candidatus Pacearchaeota archaeon CG10_big_fil_rev_8_21_14_0_10_35_219]
MKKHKTPLWKNILAILGVLFVLLFIIVLFFPSEDNGNLDYNLASQEWQNHRAVLNNDLEILGDYLEEYQNVRTASDISYLNAKIGPRLDIFDTHLIEARQFLNSYGYLFSNGAELKSDLDEKIVYSQTLRNTINVLVDDYNRQVEAYNQRVESLIRAFSLLV